MVIGFAHRGSRREHPDNTLPGFARALALGASGLESDAWVTYDGAVVLDHDGVVRRGLRRHSIAALRRVDLPGHIPALEQLYDLAGAGEAEVSLDVKDPAAAPAILVAAGAHRKRLWLCSDDLTALARWRRADTEVRLVHSSAKRRIEGPMAAHLDTLAQCGIDALNLHVDEWTPQLVAMAHEAGVRAFAWDAQHGSVITGLARMGVDGVYSDNVSTMVAVLRAEQKSEQLDAGDRPHAQHRAPDDQIARDRPDVA